MRTNKRIQGHLLAAFSILVWGTTFISTKILLRTFEPVQLVLIRFFIGYLVLCLLTGIQGHIPFENLKKELMYAAAGLFGVSLYFLGENVALTYTQASNVSVIITVAPCLTAILSWYFLKEKPRGPLFFLGFGLALAGIVLMSFTENFAVTLNPFGDFLAFLAACTWAVYSILIKKMERYGYSVFRITRRIFFYGLLFLMPAALICKWELRAEDVFRPVNVLNLLFLGILASALCYVAWNKATEYLGAVETSVYIYANPAVTILFSLLILQEKITSGAWIGIGLTISGLVLSEWKGSKKKRIHEKVRMYEDSIKNA